MGNNISHDFADRANHDRGCASGHDASRTKCLTFNAARVSVARRDRLGDVARVFTHPTDQGRVQSVLEAQTEKVETRHGGDAALHGLFHLKHARGPGLIRTYLDSRRGPDWLREYASDVLAGKAL